MSDHKIPYLGDIRPLEEISESTPRDKNGIPEIKKFEVWDGAKWVHSSAMDSITYGVQCDEMTVGFNTTEK